MGEMSPIGVPQMMVIIAVMGFALWKHGWIRVLLSLSLVIWGAFAIGVDVKIGAPLVGIGTILFFMGIFKLIQDYRNQQVM